MRCWYDNYKIIVQHRVGGDYGAEVRYRKNMNGVQSDISMENVVTRIVPVAYNGYTIDGSSAWVDSRNINKYAKVYTKEIRFDDVKMEKTHRRTMKKMEQSFVRARRRLIRR